VIFTIYISQGKVWLYI